MTRTRSWRIMQFESELIIILGDYVTIILHIDNLQCLEVAVTEVKDV